VIAYVALTRAGTIAPIVDFLERVGIRRDRLLATAKLPPWITTEREALIPGTSPARLLGAALQHADIPNLGLTVGERTDIEALGIFGRLIRSAPTLGAALESAARYSTTITSNRRCGSVAGGPVEFCMTVVDRFDPRDVAWQQDNQFCLGLMIAVVRLAAGPSWRPAGCISRPMRPQTADAAPLAGAVSHSGSPPRWSPSARVALRSPVRRPSPTDVVEEWSRRRLPAIRRVHPTGGGDLSAENTIRALGRPRFRRPERARAPAPPAAAGVTHEVVVAQTRFATAAAVLERTNAKVLDLALDLGYSDHANFTRAFRRWAGCSPQEYRVRQARRGHGGSAPPSGASGGGDALPPHRVQRLRKTPGGERTPSSTSAARDMA
jgi:hypothetical protein